MFAVNDQMLAYLDLGLTEFCLLQDILVFPSC